MSGPSRRSLGQPRRYALHQGDAFALLPSTAASSVEAIVTDPPYGIGFRGEAWDSPNGPDGVSSSGRGGGRRSACGS